MGEEWVFPETWEEYERECGFTDSEQVYTNGDRLIPSFRVAQWLAHKNAQGEWIHARCSKCGHMDVEEPDFCSRCGTRMVEEWDG